MVITGRAAARPIRCRCCRLALDRVATLEGRRPWLWRTLPRGVFHLLAERVFLRPAWEPLGRRHGRVDRALQRIIRLRRTIPDRSLGSRVTLRPFVPMFSWLSLRLGSDPEFHLGLQPIPQCLAFGVAGLLP